ncbi:16S rRNA (cytosine(967)-C(5))-methyltransferase RsmB [Neisseria leonii]|uniref:16S rRNA (cytosine(967)-C(5))-methyltransferase n=1 Tax=Neisseria leonii TaxID=2995413 RepID=A0A9X4E1R1_9NEIS|nr:MULTISPECIES: 16S rRNA (cytosine(967)-C(5))-methyltransferase RsmB [unclassified Neisseria]MDD9325747.1 16S rRNA (cytosine(967)-C(5))-methyltransferase RsmB [Neisseria sp. 3986]MDD9327888.1 16S rRNA (cytosine(967)-C(5))-methyltransferase RsmB [Neisseria sp. 51.81]
MSMARAQQLAADAVAAVSDGRNLQDILVQIRAHHPDLSAQENGTLQDLAYGTLRYLGSLRAMLGRLLTKPIGQRDLESLLLVALYQLNHTRNAPHAVVNEAVQAAGRIGRGQFRAFANAVLRRFLREKDKLNAQLRHDAARHNFPQWWLDYLAQAYPKHWHNIVAAANGRPPLTLRINRRRSSADDYLTLLAQNGIAAEKLGDDAVKLEQALPVAQIPGFSDGLVSVQDFGAQQAAALIAPQAGERILDACAAPGGKTGHLLETADCHVVALDIDAARLARVHDNLNRLNVSDRAELHCADAQDTAAWYDGEPFDAVLADVPCTASGTVKRNPDIKWLRRPNDAAKTARQQEAMLDSLWSVLKSGGRMLLATCSIFHEENHGQLQKFLARHADAECTESHTLLPNANQDGFYYALIRKN